MSRTPYNRPENDGKLHQYIRDSENTMMYSPVDAPNNKFMGSYNKFLNLKNSLMYEDREKYIEEYSARFQGKLRYGSLPLCFDHCVTDVEGSGALNAKEKNCMRECYFKKVSSKDDMNMHFQQRLSGMQIQQFKDRLV